MLTLQQLLNLTPEKIRFRASFPRVKQLKLKKDQVSPGQKYRALYFHTSLGNTESSGSTYKLAVRIHGTKGKPGHFNATANSLIWCNCSCPFFKYNLEVALASKGSSTAGEYSNGNMPRIRNPKLRPYLCKHLYASLLFLLATENKKHKGKYDFLIKE